MSHSQAVRIILDHRFWVPVDPRTPRLWLWRLRSLYRLVGGVVEPPPALRGWGPVRVGGVAPAPEPERDIDDEQDDIDDVAGQGGRQGQRVAAATGHVDQGAEVLNEGGQGQEEGKGGLVTEDAGPSPFLPFPTVFEQWVGLPLLAVPGLHRGLDVQVRFPVCFRSLYVLSKSGWDFFSILRIE
ncbi:hypothetical protein PG984_014723 [Apiospora sp. TS-2023a]